MTLLESIKVNQDLFLPTFETEDNNGIEIEILGYILIGDVFIDGIWDSVGNHSDVGMKFFKVETQEFNLTAVYDTEKCEDIEFTKEESDAVNEWFKSLEINVE